MSSTADDMLEGLSVSISALSDAGREQVYEALDQAEGATGADAVDVREVVQDAEAADYYRAQAEEFQQLQAKAVSDGNWDLARDYAQQAEFALDSVADHGGSDVPAAQAAEDVANLDNARWEQRQANDAARAASTYAEEGDGAAAQVYASAADRHQVLADDAGQSGLEGAREQHADSGGLSGDEPAQDDHAPDADGGGNDAAAPEPADSSPPPELTTDTTPDT
jgi:hypothetical protein